MGLSVQSNGGSLQLSTLSTIQTLAASILPTQGNVFFVNPRTGNDVGGQGTRDNPYKTIAAAFSKCVAGQNDTIFLCAAGNTAADTTDYQTTSLLWNKDLVHLIGINDGSIFSQRSRVAFASTYATAAALINVSASGCAFRNIEFFMGVASALPLGCMVVSGQRNTFTNCHIAGFGNTANDIAGAYSLSLAAAQENLFQDCTIGVDTVTLGAAANSQIVCSAAATRNWFRNCRVMTYTNSATNNVFLRAPAASLDRELVFEDTQFVNPIDSSSTNLTQAFVVVSNGGTVLLVGAKTGVFGATDWNATDSGNVTAINGSVTAGTFGLAVDVTR
tara:strand:+ start:216 stop:1211 length:996 start_codon:yes stop_codon:yes gene_type:complete